MNSDFNILIAGLGLMGGSLAKALRGFKNSKIFGFDLSADVVNQAKADGVIDDGSICAKDFSGLCDLVIVCLYPDLAIDFINNNSFKKGAVVTDICGVKQYVLENIKNEEIDFLGAHPMAGRELSGYSASKADLFKNASYILTPSDKTSEHAVSLMKELADFIGCSKVTITTPEKHDEMIAYTSQLMHVVAVALCDNELLEMASGYSAGSLRDCTRVADLNAPMWSELFFENKEELIKRINEFEKSMDTIKEHLLSGNTPSLCDFLKKSAKRKRNFLS